MRYSSRNSRPGMIVVQVAISLTAMLGFVAVALDGGLLLDQKRRVQAGSDAAALAAASDLFANCTTNDGVDVGGTAKSSALSTALSNGYSNDGTTSVVTVNIPPKTGFATGKPGYAEVIITYYQKRGFSSIFGSGDLPVVARAVARGQYSALESGIIVLDPTKKGSLSVNGNGVLTAVDTPVIVNSTDSAGGTFSGNAYLSAPQWDFSGSPGYTTAGGGFITGSIASNVPQTPDPLRFLPEPDQSTLPVQSTHTVKINGNGHVTLDPGVYQGGISLSGNANVTFNPGIYYMAGGGISCNSYYGSIVGNGVMIFNGTDKSGQNNALAITSSGGVTISPMTTGVYQGISIFQTRSSSLGIDVTGNGSMNMTGTFYNAKGALNIAGNGTTNVIGAQYISYDLNISGNGSLNVVWKNNPTARVRILGLVE